MAGTLDAKKTRTLLGNLAELYDRRRAKDPLYDALLYRTSFLPGPELFELIVALLAERRAETDAPSIPGDLATREAIRDLVAPMIWPDVEPLGKLARLLPDWDTLHLSALMHAEIPDYAVFGPEEARAVTELGIPIGYDPEPERAKSAYAVYLGVLHDLREAARYPEVPETNHFLTRLIQAALHETGTQS